MKILKLVVLVLTIGFFTNSASAQMSKKADAKHMMEKKAMSDNVTIIELTQIDGEFITTNLDLKPGQYQFRIVNKDVNKEVGFLIQEKADANKDPMKTAVENSFAKNMIKTGTAEYTGVVTLTEGEYVYSCPINPTPKYTISVK
jgi:hypothetical protein